MTDVKELIARLRSAHSDMTPGAIERADIDGIAFTIEEAATALEAALSGTREAVEPVGEYPLGTVWFGYDENTGEFTGTSCSVKPHDTRGMRAYAPITAAPPSDPVGQGAVTDLAKRLRAATMRFDWTDIPDDEPVPAIPLLREAANVLSALSPAPEAGNDEVERLTRERDEWRAAFENNVDSNVRRVWKSLCDLTRQQHQETKMLLKAAEARETDLRDQLGKMREALEPFALIGSEGVIGGPETTGHVEIITQAEYFHRAAATLAETQEAGR